MNINIKHLGRKVMELLVNNDADINSGKHTLIYDNAIKPYFDNTKLYHLSTH